MSAGKHVRALRDKDIADSSGARDAGSDGVPNGIERGQDGGNIWFDRRLHRRVATLFCDRFVDSVAMLFDPLEVIIIEVYMGVRVKLLGPLLGLSRCLCSRTAQAGSA